MESAEHVTITDIQPGWIPPDSDPTMPDVSWGDTWSFDDGEWFSRVGEIGRIHMTTFSDPSGGRVRVTLHGIDDTRVTAFTSKATGEEMVTVEFSSCGDSVCGFLSREQAIMLGEQLTEELSK
jgi:hypothetical protein